MQKAVNLLFFPNSVVILDQKYIFTLIFGVLCVFLDIFMPNMHFYTFLDPRGPLVLPLVGSARRSVCAKNLGHLYTGSSN